MTNMLNKTDKRILYNLMDDARMPDSVIANKVGTSKQVVNYRIKRLEKLKIITGYRAKINISLFGFSSYCVYLQLNNTADEASLIAELEKNPFVRWLISCTGRWDLIFTLSAKNVHDFNRLLNDIMVRIEKSVKAYDTTILLYTKDLIPEFLFDLGQKEEPALVELHEAKSIDIDKTEKKMLELLQNDARMPIISLAEKLGVSPYVARYKMRSLMKSGVINQFKPAIDFELLGYEWYHILLHTKNLTEKDEANLIENLKTIKGVTYITKCIGKWNFEVHLSLASNLKFKETLGELKAKLANYIISYDTLIVSKRYKSQSIPEGVLAELGK